MLFYFQKLYIVTHSTFTETELQTILSPFVYLDIFLSIFLSDLLT